MRLLRMESEPIFSLPCVIAAPGGKKTMEMSLPFLWAEVSGLPDTIDALILTGDLQGYDTNLRPISERRLLGNLVPSILTTEAVFLERLPDPERVGIVLTGDLYALPSVKERGGLGDVDQVWWDFADRFRFVAGVAGNHDLFSGKPSFAETSLRFAKKCFLLEHHHVCPDQIGIAGISGIVGHAKKAWRRPPSTYQAHLQRLLAQKPDLLALHSTPSIPEQGLIGEDMIRQALDSHQDELLVACGHCHWREPFVQLHPAVGIFSVDFRVIILAKPRETVVSEIQTGG